MTPDPFPNPRRTFVLDEGFYWTCRYCGHEHGGTLGRATDAR